MKISLLRKHPNHYISAKSDQRYLTWPLVSMFVIGFKQSEQISVISGSFKHRNNGSCYGRRVQTKGSNLFVCVGHSQKPSS